MLAFAGASLLLGLATPLARSALESSMVGQMLVQMPLLAMIGAACATAMPAHWRRSIDAWNGGGRPGLLLASLGSTYWMLPRALDAALASAAVEAAKFVSLPLLLGVPIGLSWPKLNPIAKGFFLANLISMLGVLGWLYREAPVRLCNYYLVDQQVIAGNALIAIAIATAGAWFAWALAGGRRTSKTHAAK